jgi:alpha-beta hydrolase superfamily lysophospholipase
LSVGQTLDYETPLGSSIPANIEASPLVETEHRRHVETIQREDAQRDSVLSPMSGNDTTSHSPVNSVHITQAKSDAVAVARRPRIILIGDSAGGNLVLALARWIRDEGVLPAPDGMLLLSPSCDPCTLHSLVNGPDSLT